MKIKLLTLLYAFIVIACVAFVACDKKDKDKDEPEQQQMGVFAVSKTKQVRFAPGNLQATYDGNHWNWAFAVNPWDYIGNAAANTAITGNGTVSTNGTVDLFCWSTASTYYGIHNSISWRTYSGDFVDWGNNIGEEWRTLSDDEWSYLFDTRANAKSLRGQATVNGTHGYILLPDGWKAPKGLSFQGCPNNWTMNQYTLHQWTDMQTSGAVFLPAAGWSNGAEINEILDYGYYWSSTPDDADAYGVCFHKDYASKVYFVPRNHGYSVRLVQDVK